MNHDFGLFKNFKFANSRKFQFRASFTNVFNHPQRFMDDNLNLKLDYPNGVLNNVAFRRAAAESQVRPAHHPAGVQVPTSELAVAASTCKLARGSAAGCSREVRERLMIARHVDRGGSSPWRSLWGR